MQTMNRQSGSLNQATNMSKQTLPQNQQQQNPRLTTSVNGGLDKGPTLLDEFKNGFPSEGLSVASNKWWGSNSHDEEPETKGETEEKPEDVADEMETEEEKEINNAELTGTSLLTAVRRKAAAEGREALKLGVFRNRNVREVDDRERNLLLELSHSTSPKERVENS